MGSSKPSASYFHTQSVDEVLNHLKVNKDKGLSQAEVNERQKVYGFNKLQAHQRKSILRIFLAQLNDTLIYVLLAAVLITAFVGEHIDAIIILIVILINALLGVIQEVKANNAIDALRDLATPKTKVNRDGFVHEINTEELVPGDIVLLEAGQVVPADLRLVESYNLKLDESALTGEAINVEKDADSIFTNTNLPIGDLLNLAFMNTLVTHGRGIGVVIETAERTEVGKIAEILKEEEEVKTPLEIRLDNLGKTLGFAAIAICVLIFIISYFQGRDLAEMFLTSVSLAVAAIPEGLAAIVAVVLSIGVTKMAKRNAIIKKLHSVETLGSVNIVCSDKTGTLTQNKMTVKEIFTFTDEIKELNNELSSEGILLVEAMVLASDATLENGESTGDPTEIALLHMADEVGIDRKELIKSQKRLDELAFDSDRKMMSTFHEKQGEFIIYTKGAIEHLINRCTSVLENGVIVPLNQDHKNRLDQASELMSSKALRTLGVAYKTVDQKISKENFEEDLILLGIVGMIDPPREEVKSSIEFAKQAGISTVMITGDHRNTALAIAQELGIADDISQTITGNEINSFDQKTLESQIDKYKVYARVSPEHKVRIVRAYRKKGNIVAMTGDGINDAPSLNAADIGVAMGIQGTDVAKNASDMILADDNFSTIISAIKYGRDIYKNIKKAVVFLLTCNLGEVIIMFISILAGLPLPLIATQLLWINLVTDTLPAIALGMDLGDRGVMKEKPRSLQENFFSGGAGMKILLGGGLIGVLSIFSFLLGYHHLGVNPFDKNLDESVHQYSRTLVFLTLIACQLFYSLSFRHDYKSIFTVGIFSNQMLILAILLGFALQIMIIYTPVLREAFRLQAVGINEWIFVLILGLLPLLSSEIIKFFKRRKLNYSH